MGTEKNIKVGNQTGDMVYIGVFAAVIAVCAWISIPTAVPFTLQTFGVFAAMGLLGGKRGTVSVLIYILMGSIGLPVFAGAKGGLGVLLGTTGGYLAGYFVAGLFMWAVEVKFGRSLRVLAVSMTAGLLVCYAFGTAWFMLVYLKSTGPVAVSTVLGWCVIPFILPDILKIILALAVTKKFRRYVTE